jgi:hypothetical protein
MLGDHLDAWLHMATSSQPQHLFAAACFVFVFFWLSFIAIITDQPETLDLEN